MSIQGSCLCKKIQFSIPEQILWSAHCHCSLCRKAQGAAFVTGVITRASLDSELPHPVECHAYYQSRVNWTQADPHLPKKG